MNTRGVQNIINHEVSLTDEEKSEIDALAAHYPEPSGASVDALLVVQKQRGWVSDSALLALARHLRMSTADLDSVATFYNLVYRKPVGDVVLHPCEGVSCELMGYDDIDARVKEKLGVDHGGTTSDGRFTLIPLPCLGACDKAPVMCANGAMYENLDSGGVDKIIDQLQKSEEGAVEDE